MVKWDGDSKWCLLKYKDRCKDVGLESEREGQTAKR